MTFNWLRRTHPVSVIAHRGYNAKYPENTIIAFEKAIEVGADYCELDIEFTKDGKIVVIHDDTTQRVADRNLDVKKSTLAELKTLDLGQSQCIPTLEEVLEVAEGKIGLNIEIKGRNMAEKLNEILQKFNMDKDLIISSFHHQEIIDFHKINPGIKIATLEPVTSSIMNVIKLTFSKSSLFTHAKEVEVDAIHPFTALATKKFIDRSHELGYAVNIWTSDSPDRWEKLIANGVDGIVTNDPESLINYLKI